MQPVVHYAQEDRTTSIIRQLSELVVTIMLMGFAYQAHQAGGSGELVGGIVGVVATYWINKGTSSQAQRGFQEVTARALNGPLSAVADTNLLQTSKVDSVVQELSNLRVLIAGLQQQYGRRSNDDRDALVAATTRASHAEGKLEAIVELPLEVTVVNPPNEPVPVATVKPVVRP